MPKAMTSTRRIKSATGDKIFSLGLLAPAILLTFVFILVPVIDSVIKSFTEYKIKNVISGAPGTWNNFENYIKLFQNDKLMPAIITTFVFVFAVVISQFLIGFILAVILDSKIRGSRFLRSIMMMPWVVPTMISGMVWLWLYQPQYGLLRYLVQVVTGGSVADFAILSVPSDMLEAATVDGASALRRFVSIVIPYMMSVIKVTVSMSIIENFKQFPLFWTMTGGGPDGATTTLAILSYREAFVSNDLGSGAAVTTVWMLLMILVVFAYNKIFKAEPMD